MSCQIIPIQEVSLELVEISTDITIELLDVTGDDLCSVAGGVTFEYPVTSPTWSLSLRSPELGDNHSVHSTRVKDTTRGLTRKVFRDTIWPKYHIFSGRIVGLAEADRDCFLEFLYHTLGKEIKLTDFRDRAWRGIISNPNGESTREFVDCGYTVEFEFQGERI